jgi:hypothetical protein
MRLSRLRFTVRRLMISVAACALALALLRDERGTWLLFFVVGPVIGALGGRALGGRGFLGGGLIGGVAAFWVFGAFRYAWAYLHLEPGRVEIVGPVPIFLILGFEGAFVGSVVGAIIWWIWASYRSRYSPGDAGTGEL